MECSYSILRHDNWIGIVWHVTFAALQAKEDWQPYMSCFRNMVTLLYQLKKIEFRQPFFQIH
jgi:hypothetical protein